VRAAAHLRPAVALRRRRGQLLLLLVGGHQRALRVLLLRLGGVLLLGRVLGGELLRLLRRR
jgi:hypothetical protein